MSGYFVKAVVQLVFSRPVSADDDLLLFAVGQDYKIAIYNVDPRDGNKVGLCPIHALILSSLALSPTLCELAVV